MENREGHVALPGFLLVFLGQVRDALSRP